MTVTTNYLVTGNGITGSTANAVQSLVSRGGKPQYISATGRVNVGVGNIATVAQTGRTSHRSPSGLALRNLRMRLTGWWLSSAGVVTNANNDMRVAVSIEYPIGTAPRPFYLNGVRQMIVPVGGTIEAVEQTGFVLPPDADFYLHHFVEGWVSGAQGGTITFSTFMRRPTGVSWDRLVLGAPATDKTQTIGGETATIGTPQGMWAPFAVLGDPVIGAPVRQPSVLVLGDSITYGKNEDTSMTGDTVSGYAGPYQRWIAGRGGIPMTMCGVSSLTASALASKFNTTDSPQLLAALSDVATHVLIALGRNDMGGTVSALRTNLSALAAPFVADGKVVLTNTISPQASSTDSYATLANQTANANNTTRVAYNAELRQSLPANISGYLEVADLCEPSRDAGKWIVDGNANYATTDGLHPSAAMHAIIAAGLPDPATVFTV